MLAATTYAARKRRKAKWPEPMNEPSLVQELRNALAELQRENADLKRQIGELRGAVVALMEPDMPRILRTPGGIVILDAPDSA